MALFAVEQGENIWIVLCQNRCGATVMLVLPPVETTPKARRRL